MDADAVAGRPANVAGFIEFQRNCAVHFALSTCAVRITNSAVANKRPSRWDPTTGKAAAQRITNTPRAGDVMCGNTRSLAQAPRPSTTIRRGRLGFDAASDREPVTIVSRSRGPSVADQLMQMSTISPSGFCKRPISSGSSCATDEVWGHHAPSMSPPRCVARASLTGRAKRLDPVKPFTMLAAYKTGQPYSCTGSFEEYGRESARQAECELRSLRGQIGFHPVDHFGTTEK